MTPISEHRARNKFRKGRALTHQTVTKQIDSARPISFPRRLDAPTPIALTLFIFGYGQGLVMAPRSGAVFFAVEALQSARAAFLVSLALFVTLIMICAAFLAWMRRASARS